MIRTLCGFLDDCLVELDAVQVAVIAHVRAEHHVFIEVPGVQEHCRALLLPNVVVDVVFPWHSSARGRHE